MKRNVKPIQHTYDYLTGDKASSTVAPTKNEPVKCERTRQRHRYRKVKEKTKQQPIKIEQKADFHIGNQSNVSTNEPIDPNQKSLNGQT